MKYRIPYYLMLGALCFALLSPFSASAQKDKTSIEPAGAGQITLDFHDVELTDLIQTISELTGRNFLYDDTVKGKVTIISPDSMTLDEAYQLFLSVLYVKGYTIVPSGKINKIVPVKNAKEANLPTVTNGTKFSSEQFITRMVRLNHLDAATIATTVLAPLLPSSGNIVAYPPTNTLIITESAATIERLMGIVRELDIPGSASVLEVLPLQNADADELAKIILQILDQPNVSRASRARRDDGASTAQAPQNKVIAYKRTNSLIVMTNAEDLALIKGLISRMDQVSDSKRSNINLYYLENANAETLAGTLNEILTGIKAQARQDNRDNKNPVSVGPVSITADKPTNSLIINSNPEDYETLKTIIGKLDIKRKQVYVEALILELSLDATQRLGVSLQGGGAVNGKGLAFGSSNQNTGVVGIGSAISDSGVTGVPDLLTTAVEGLLAGGFFNPVTVTGPTGELLTVPTLSVLLDLSKKNSDVNILSAPRLLTSDNEEAEIIVGSNVPVITGRLTDSGSQGLAQSVSVERQDVALILRFTPQITEGDLVRLNIYQELTDLVPASSGLSASVGDPSQVGPSFTKRVLRNTVLAENGRTIVLGGLIDTNMVETVTKVPLLGDIPLLGWLFKRKASQEEKTNLLVFINPTIIKSSEDLERVTGRNRKVASGFLSEDARAALPENFFGVPLEPEEVMSDNSSSIGEEDSSEEATTVQ